MPGQKKIDEESQRIIDFYSEKIRFLRILPFELIERDPGQSARDFVQNNIGKMTKEIEETRKAEKERDLTTGAILERARDLLEPKDYRRLLREIDIKSQEATKTIDKYIVFREAVSNGISEIHILRVKKKDLSDLFYIPRGKREPSVYIAIEYDEEDRLYKLIDHALERFHEDEELLKKIKKEISYRGRSAKKKER